MDARSRWKWLQWRELSASGRPLRYGYRQDSGETGSCTCMTQCPARRPLGLAEWRKQWRVAGGGLRVRGEGAV